MLPQFVDDIFSSGHRHNGERSEALNTCHPDSGAAGRVLTTDITPAGMKPVKTRSPKKSKRVMTEKGVDTTELRDEKKRKNSESPEKKHHRVFEGFQTLTAKASRTSMASSQVSFWDGDEEFEDLVMQCDEQEVELMPDTQPSRKPPSSTSGSGSSGTSLSSAKTASTARSSTNSDSSKSSVVESPRRRKRDDSPGSECHRPHPSAAVPLRTLQIHTVVPQLISQQEGVIESPVSATATASFTRASKQPRPIPRSPAVVNTSTVTASGTFHSTSSTASTTTVPVPKSPTKPTRKSHTTPASPFIIAHDKKVQALLDGHCISKGVQIEIARGVTQQWWDWSDVTEDKVQLLIGTNAEKAGKVFDIIGSKGPKQTFSPAVLISRQAIYAELDRENMALREGRERGLGLMGPWHGEDEWYGGRIQLNARLCVSKNKMTGQNSYSIKLENFGYGKSNRVTRYVTSLSILQLKIEKDAKNGLKDGLIDFLAQRFVLCGRQFCPFHPKEDKVYLVEINEDFERRAVRQLGDELRRPFDAFINWHNSLERNSNQPISKWATRWALSLSTSRPVLEFEPQNIFLNIPDIYAEGQGNNAEAMMTDGCGFINLSALVQIAKVVKANCPTAIQGRLAGAKGLWLLHPDSEHRSLDEPPKIWIRNSQIKVKHPPTSEWERSHLIFDLVRIQRLTIPSSLYMQTIQNMSHNGVKDEVFEQLLEIGLKKEIDALTNWDGSNARVHLARAVENAGGIAASRLSRLAGSDARLYGYIRDERKGADGDAEEEDDAVIGLIERDPCSGCPVSLYESTREMLLAGFAPLQSPLLRDKLRQIMKNVIDAYLEQYHIPIDLSAEAFIVPDPYGVLEEGEIYFRSTKCIGDPTTSADPHTFLGPVLVTRNPTGVASDVRKVTAVSHDKLLSYTDVIVFSIKGHRSLASYLGGGDYDGDTVTVIAEPTVVNSFENSRIVDAPQDLRDKFEREIEKVSAFLSRVKDLPVWSKEQELFKKLLLGLSDSKVGLYSMFHDNAVYSLGYDCPETIRLAYMFTTCLDASKTGLRVKNDVFREDAQRWNLPRPHSMQKSDEIQRNHMKTSNLSHLPRPQELGPFVLDSLMACGKALHSDAIVRYDTLCKSVWRKTDPDLADPYNRVKLWITHAKDRIHIVDDLRKVETLITELCNAYIVEVGEYHGKSSSPRKGNRRISYDSMGSSTTPTTKSMPLSAIQRKFAAKFEEGPPDVCFMTPDLTRQIKASYAYIFASNRSSGKLATEFPFVVAHGALCAIKAQKEGPVTLTREGADYTALHGSLLKSSAQLDG